MGFRLRKTVGLLPGLRLNISKQGGSFSLGRKGLSVNIGRQGVRTTVGLPGSGLSYSTYKKYENDNEAPQASKGLPWGIIALVALVAVALAWGL